MPIKAVGPIPGILKNPSCTLVLYLLVQLTQVCPGRYAGPMERAGAEGILTNRSDGTYLVRQRVKDSAEFAISIK